jgi:hypothetical protein
MWDGTRRNTLMANGPRLTHATYQNHNIKYDDDDDDNGGDGSN